MARLNVAPADGEGRRVVITGAAGGIGEALVAAFASRGDSVAAVTHVKPLDEQILSLGNVTEYRCDLTDELGVEETFGRIALDLGGVDALLHTAAVVVVGPAHEVRGADISRMMTVNFGSTVFVNQAVLPHMRRCGGGSIVNFTSEAGILGTRNAALYAATKAAIAGWTRSVADEWGADGIRVNALAPLMQTPMLDYDLEVLEPAEVEELRRTYRNRIALGGWPGEPGRDLAPVAVFLASDGARFITGQTISVDGGFLKLG